MKGEPGEAGRKGQPGEPGMKGDPGNPGTVKSVYVRQSPVGQS